MAKEGYGLYLQKGLEVRESFKRVTIVAVIAVVILQVTGSSAWALPTVIDNFTDGDLSATLDSTNTSMDEVQTGLDPAAVIGGRRRVQAMLNYPVEELKQAIVTIDASTGIFQLDTDHDLEFYGLEWGLRSLSDGAAELALNANLWQDTKEEQGFLIRILSASQSTMVGIEVRSGVDEDAIESDFGWVNLPASPTSYSVFADEFLFPDVDLTDVDYISIGEGPMFAGLDITFDEIIWVPEPATLGLLLLGGLALLRNRKHTLS